MRDPIWVIMPVLAGPEMTEAAISDVLAQSVPTKLLIINQGVDEGFRDRLERIAEQESARIFLWHHVPPLPSLAASWNLGLELAWQSGGQVALVINNDVRLHPRTVSCLQSALVVAEALFVSAVGVTAEQFDSQLTETQLWDQIKPGEDPASITKGGPDFSCFLIARACHQAFPFDEHFIPAFCEDLDYHRRLMLAGEGTRIFSVNLPYLHYASQTLKQVSAPEAERIRGAIQHQSRAYYLKKWGGPVNAETFWAPFDGEDRTAIPGYFQAPETPNLFDVIRTIWREGDPRVRAMQRPSDRQILEEADPGERWADSNQQEDERAASAELPDGATGGSGDGGLRGAADEVG
jgi:GT2 family glycosyltransferase